MMTEFINVLLEISSKVNVIQSERPFYYFLILKNDTNKKDHIPPFNFMMKNAFL